MAVRACQNRPMTQTRTAIISDIHGDLSLLRGILVAIGAVDSLTGAKQPGWRIYSIGDLVNRASMPYYLKVPPSATREQRDQLLLGEQARDFACLEQAELWLDGACLGNHECADLGGLQFSGYDGTPSPIQDRVKTLYHKGWYMPSLAVGRWFISHAGIHPRFWGDEYGVDVEGRTAAEISEDVNTQYAKVIHGPDLPTFSRGWMDAIGEERWGGPFRMKRGGGLFWCGWEALAEGYLEHFEGENLPDDALHQMVGHTPQKDGPRKAGKFPLVNIDVGAKHFVQAAAAITGDNGATWETRVYHGRNEALKI